VSRKEGAGVRPAVIRPPRLLDALAREVFALFPRCVRCGERIARYEDADVRIFGRRVTHRGACPGAADAVSPLPR
jgi:hypothetical protein